MIAVHVREETLEGCLLKKRSRRVNKIEYYEVILDLGPAGIK